MKKLALLAIAALTGCASSGPVPIGLDTYMITKQSAGGIFVSPSTIKTEVIKEGYVFCQAQGKEFQMVSTNELGAIPAARMPSAEVQFMCLNKNDPQLTRTLMQKTADTVVEIRK